MATRSLYLYKPLGGKHSSWRDLLYNPVRCTAILLIVVLSLTSIGFLTIQRPWRSTLTPNTFIPVSEQAELEVDVEQPEELEVELDAPIPELIEPVPEIIDATVYHPFFAPSPEDVLVDQTVRPIRAHRALSDECLDKWVATGLWQDPCRYNMVQDSRIDLVYVWVNGSDPLHQKARQALLKSTKYWANEARFREHDELRYSLRAARNATASWRNSTWHIVTADISEPTASGHERRLGLVPQWLDIECAFYGCPDPETQPPIRLQHDTQLFRLTGRPGVTLQANNATDWLDKVLPSFNSHAVESQLPHLDPEIVSDAIVALNDDQFMLLPLPPSAFHTTLYGPVFRMDPNLLVAGDSTGHADGGGEWRSLGWSAYLLNQRFGTRRRPYMQHNARALSLPLMHEVSLAFGEYFAATPLSQFRGSHKVPNEYEVNTIFIATHYVIERHREALLWSWVVGKWGGHSGTLGPEQKRKMWEELGGSADILSLEQAKRRTSNDVEVNLLMAGLQPPRAVDPQTEGDTTYSWGFDIVSMDGYSANFHSLARRIDMNRDCIDEDTEQAWDMFRRFLQSDTACGDNIIAALIHNARSGLDVFLPAPSSTATHSPSDPIILPLDLPTTAPPLPKDPRAFAVRLLMRYAYVLGDTPTTFMGMKSAVQTERLLHSTDRQKNVALLCINDDLENTNQKAAEDVIKKWFQRRWPQKLACEL
ncbi:hypothetical protein B0H12DRAFT_1320991 [Mycena haematopus]|nr:hypothetical protein B0H12DRAFT_1320991 [Mycena haematopus]